MSKTIDIICPHCSNRYQVPYSKYEHMRNRIIQYALCPNCGSPRDPLAWEEDAANRCEVCNCPIKDGYRLCHAHYVEKWRVERKR